MLVFGNSYWGSGDRLILLGNRAGEWLTKMMALDKE